MFRTLNALHVLAAVPVLWFGGALSTPIHALGRTNYQESCHRIAMSGATLLAACRRVDGSFNRTSIVLAGIENIGGRLVYTQPDRPSTFQNTCRHIYMAGGYLIATCRRPDGESNQTLIFIDDLSNIDGNLQFGYR
jgi:hypothetical protein